MRDLLKISDVQLNPETITNVVVEHFPNREGQVVFEFITELIRTSNNKVVFNQTIKDFLVTTRQFYSNNKTNNDTKSKLRCII